MRTSETIRALVKDLSERTGKEWKTTYYPHYGGYELYYCEKGSTGHLYGQYGVMYRKTPSEMLNYLKGLLNR